VATGADAARRSTGVEPAAATTCGTSVKVPTSPVCPAGVVALGDEQIDARLHLTARLARAATSPATLMPRACAASMMNAGFPRPATNSGTPTSITASSCLRAAPD